MIWRLGAVLHANHGIYQVGFRPPFKFPGLWLYNGGSYPETFGVVHIIGVDPEDPEGLKEYLGDRDLASLKGTGTVDHMAFRATGLAQMRARLQQAADCRFASARFPRLACIKSSSKTPAT